MKLEFVDTIQFEGFVLKSAETDGWYAIDDDAKYDFIAERFDMLRQNIDDNYVQANSKYEGLIGQGAFHCSVKLCGTVIYIVCHNREEVEDVYNYLSQVCN